MFCGQKSNQFQKKISKIYQFFLFCTENLKDEKGDFFKYPCEME